MQCKYLLLGLQWQIIDTNRNQRTSAFSTKLTVQIIVICGSQPYIHSYQTCLVFTDDCNLKRKTTKGQIKPKADWRAKDSPKKRTNKFDCKFQVFRDCKAKNQNWFVRFLEESMVLQSAYGFFWPLCIPNNIVKWWKSSDMGISWLNSYK